MLTIEIKNILFFISYLLGHAYCKNLELKIFFLEF